MPLGDASFALLLGGCQVGLDPGDTVAGYRSPVDAEGRQGKQTMQGGGQGGRPQGSLLGPPSFFPGSALFVFILVSITG